MARYARDCDPTLGAVIATLDGGAKSDSCPPGPVQRHTLTAQERERIRVARDLDARRRAIKAGAKIALNPNDDSPQICEAITEAGCRCTNQVHEGRRICGVHRRRLAA